MKKQQTSLKDIAQVTGYSLSTVSFVLNGRADGMRISPETQRLIMKTAKQMGYEIPGTQNSIKQRAKQLRIALFWDDFSGTSLNAFLTAMEEGVQSRGNFDYVVVPYRTGKFNEKEYLLSKPFYDGAILTGLQDDELARIETMQFGIPVVIFNRYSKAFSCVNTDDYEVGQTAFNILHKNHRKYALILPSASLSSVMRINSLRKSGFQDAAAVLNVPDSDISIQTGANTIQGGFSAFEQLIQLSVFPSCIFCASGYMAAGILQCAKQHNIDIPKDIVLIAGNDLPSHSMLMPTITSFHMPYTEMVSNCLDILLQEISANASFAVCKTSSMPCIFRDSCPDPNS